MNEVRDNAERHRFEMEVDGMLATADYEMSGNTMVLTHTRVPSHHQGQGIGEALARTALDAARARHLKVDPQCAFMAHYIEDHPEYQDLIAG